MEDPDGEICGTKAERAVKFNERYDALNHFVLKDNELYRRAMKVGQPERLVVCDYNAAETIEKVHAQLEHAGNSKTFTKIKQLYYETTSKWLNGYLSVVPSVSIIVVAILAHPYSQLLPQKSWNEYR